MVLITLIGEPTAKVGSRFYYLGPLIECRECRLRNVCFNLEPGGLYEVTGLRDQRHECMLREDEVHVVEVERVAVPAALPKKQAIEGSIITVQMPRCDNPGCDHHRLCFPVGAADGGRYSVEEVGDDLDCPVGESMVRVLMR
jgi:uncharacterized protein (UPF0179 family)